MQACADRDLGSLSFFPATAAAGTTCGTSACSLRVKDEIFCKGSGHRHHQQLPFHTGSQPDPVTTCISYQPTSDPLKLGQVQVCQASLKEMMSTGDRGKTGRALCFLNGAARNNTKTISASYSPHPLLLKEVPQLPSAKSSFRTQPSGNQISHQI